MKGGLLRVVEQFVDNAAGARDMPELTGHVGDVGGELGLPYFAMVHHVSLRRSAPRLIESSNYPAVWQAAVRTGIFVDDPVLHASQRAVNAFVWDQIGRFLPVVSDRHRAILAQSRREGIGEGMTIPANVPGEPNGSCSFATRAGRPLPSRSRLFAAQLVGSHAFERARQLNGLPRVCDQVPHLSPREEECLRMLVGGASDKLIARQLKLSPETARRYIKTARAAYGAATRTELVVRALRDGLVSFDDAIPPDG